jgi:hypothetical protein
MYIYNKHNKNKNNNNNKHKISCFFGIEIIEHPKFGL